MNIQKIKNMSEHLLMLRQLSLSYIEGQNAEVYYLHMQ